MNNVPFAYGKLPGNEDFTNRRQELARLENNFVGLVNTILISPRRWGKTSLVRKAADNVIRKNKQIRVLHLDIFNIRSEEEFYLSLANEVLRVTSTSWEDFMQSVKLFLSRLVPQVSFSPDKQTEVSFGLAWKDLQREPDEILSLAENIAARKKIKIIVCIDEFQNINQFKEPEAFQRKLRSQWQMHQNVCYCLYGSKRHMLMDIFSNSAMPFYKFGDIVFLDKIQQPEWVSFIVKRFKDTGKTISKSVAALIAQKADNHSYYVQQLAQQSWFRTVDECSEEIVEVAHEELISQLSLLFTNITEGLSSRQLGLLRAIVNEEKQLSSKDVLSRYNLGTSANVLQLKKALIANDILDDASGKLEFLDPMYEHWIRKYYFEK